jgi:hypothetical protein
MEAKALTAGVEELWYLTDFCTEAVMVMFFGL